MRFRLVVSLCILAFIAACQSTPPTQIIMVVTATPGAAEASTAQTANTTVPVTAAPTTISASATPAATATIDPFPTATTGQVQIAEQVFEHGRMFWIQPREQIWVMYDSGQGSGQWAVYEDTYQDGEMESDPSIVPPSGQFQPERGFGKLWRNNADVKEKLGFGVTPEFGYVSNYEYHPGGEVKDGKYVPGSGYHILFSLYQEKFQFNEVDGTWKKL